MQRRHGLVANDRETYNQQFECSAADALAYIGRKASVAAWISAQYEGETLRVEIWYNRAVRDVEHFTPESPSGRLALAWLAMFIVNFQVMSKEDFSSLVPWDVDEATAVQAAGIAKVSWEAPRRISDYVPHWVKALAATVRCNPEKVQPKYMDVLRAIGRNPMILQP